jgi:hypothetical protein
VTDEPLETEGQFAQFATESGILDWLNDGPVEQEETPADDTASERARDEKGRFVAAAADEPEETEEVAVEAAEEPVAEQDEQVEESDDGIVIEIDDDLQSVLDKYDGDVTKALKALGESQSMIGRQGNELGELRRELQEMRQALEQGFQQQPQQQFVGPYMNDIDENPQGLVVEALERGDTRTVEMALRAWGEEDPFGATTFLLSLQQQAAQAAVPPVEQQSTPQVTGTGPTLEQAMSEVVSRHPDVEKYLSQVQQVAEEFPTLRDSMKQGSPARQAQAFEELLRIAKSRSVEGDTTKAMKKVILKAQEEVRKDKSDAAVVSAQNQSAASRQSNLDVFYEAFGEAAERYTSNDWITRSND